MSDDWLQHGHEIDSAELTTVLSSSSLLGDRVGAPPPRRFTWRAVATGGAVALLATLGVVGVANALGDNLFPSLGPTSPASVWQNPVPATEPEPADDVVTITVPTTVPTTTAPPTTSTVPITSTVPTTVQTTAPALTTSDPGRDGGDDVAITTTAAPSDDHGSDDDGSDDDGSHDDGSSSGSGSSANSGSGSSGSGSGDSIDDD